MERTHTSAGSVRPSLTCDKHEANDLGLLPVAADAFTLFLNSESARNILD